MFELVAAVCLAGVCMDRVLPQPDVMDQQACEQRLVGAVDGWLQQHEQYKLDSARCASLESLTERAAAVHEIAPGHFVHTGQVEDFLPSNHGDLANTGFIVGSEKIAVIDSGTTRRVAEALYLAVRLHSTLPITYNIITHVHPDHSLGARVFREAGAELIGASRLKAAQVIANMAYSSNLLRILGPEAFHGTVPTEIDRGIESVETIELGQRPVHLRAWPASHTTTDLTVLDEKSATVWMGDLVFLGHLPALDGSITGWIDLLKQLELNLHESLSVTLMVPGHGPATASFPNGAEATLGYLESLATQTRKSINDGESLTEATKHVGNDLRRDWHLFDEYHLRNVTNAYVELEWE